MRKSKIQVFIENIVKTLLSILKILLLTKFGVKSLKKKENANNCIILGNGPSLSETVNQNIELLQKIDCFAVNFFVKTDSFTKIKPRYYVIISENYWSEGKIDINETGRQKVFEELASKTTWKMTLIVLAAAKTFNKNNWKQKIGKNQNIDIEYVNITPIEGFKPFVRFCLKRNWGLPRPHNVLIPAIKAATDYNYKNIFIVGADHSWLKDIYVGNDNRVYLSQKHFYDNNPVPEVMYDGTSNRVRNLADVLMKFVYSFKSYFVLKEYAESKNVRIFNSTPISYIDAFDRKSLKEIQ